MNIRKHAYIGAWGAVAAVLIPATAFAQPSGPRFHWEPIAVDSRTAEEEEGSSGFATPIIVPGAAWLRVHFSEYNLGSRSYITTTSMLDGGMQRLDSRTMPQWRNRTCYFNGDFVLLELHVAPGEENIFIAVDKVMAGTPFLPPESEDQQDGGIESQCGPTDDRVLSTYSREGRLHFVTAAGNPGLACSSFLISNGSVLTAGHCVDFDPDDGGPGLPDGVLDLDNNDVVEFDVPVSTAGGQLVFADPNDQYAIDLNSVEWNFDGEGQGLGKDWAVFELFPNPNTELRAHVAQGFYRTTNSNPAAANTIRITSYGQDNTPNWTRNQAQQTHTGPYVGESSSGSNYWHRYQVDTSGGSSGAPIIWLTPSPDYIVGIHTNGGCYTDGTGANSGTSFEHNALENAMQDVPSTNTVYLDTTRYGATENGTIFHPYNTAAEAVSAASSGAIISMVEGSYSTGFTAGADGKYLRFEAPVGSVTIGN